MWREPQTIRVLLVDEESDLLLGLSRALESRGFEVATATSADAALELTNQQIFEVAVVGLTMPRRAGMETLRNIKERHPLTEVLVLTSRRWGPQTVDALNLGAFDYLTKPIDISVLAARLRDASAHRIARMNEEHARQETERKHR